jgi:hypothetical protein
MNLLFANPRIYRYVWVFVFVDHIIIIIIIINYKEVTGKQNHCGENPPSDVLGIKC